MKTSVKTAAFLSALVLVGCSAGPGEYLFIGGTMGTSWSAKVVSTSEINQPEIQAGMQAVLDNVNSKMSNWDAGSEVSLFNTGPSGCLAVSDQTVEVVRISQDLSRITGGIFDGTLGPLIDLWGFGAEFTAEQMPSPEAIEQSLQQIGYQKLSLSGNQLCKDQASLAINLSATAKGYGVDKVAEYLESIGIERYLVEVGGEVRVLGQNRNNEPWHIGIEAPLDNVISGQVQELVELEGLALATSGDYRNYFMHEGVRYSHIIDVVTGYPVPQQLASVTVLHESAAWADGWATAMLALGPERGLEMAEQQNLAAYFVLRTDLGFEVLTSSSW